MERINLRLAEVYIHPKASIPEAAIAAYVNGGHLVTLNGRARIAPGRNEDQYAKALKILALRRLEAALEAV